MNGVWSTSPRSGSEKSQVRQCLGFCTADFRSSLAYTSDAQEPKHCLNWDFSLPLYITYPQRHIALRVRLAIFHRHSQHDWHDVETRRRRHAIRSISTARRRKSTHVFGMSNLKSAPFLRRSEDGRTLGGVSQRVPFLPSLLLLGGGLHWRARIIRPA